LRACGEPDSQAWGGEVVDQAVLGVDGGDAVADEPFV
jgi:hypothetical protein